MTMNAGGFGYDPEAIYQDADIEMWELQSAAHEAEAMQRKSEKLKAAGDLMAAAEACPHGWGYPLNSPAAADNADPREGEKGERCHHCNSVVSDVQDLHSEVLHPCEPDWRPTKG